eukprot:scaffold137723_cov32-Tisochrysis_lutea.AAC.1
MRSSCAASSASRRSSSSPIAWSTPRTARRNFARCSSTARCTSSSSRPSSAEMRSPSSASLRWTRSSHSPTICCRLSSVCSAKASRCSSSPIARSTQERGRESKGWAGDGGRET